MRTDHLEQAVDRMRDRFPTGIIPREVRDWIDRSPEDEPWAVACSGGADSTFLLLFLLGHFPLRRIHLHLLHYDHATRGEVHDVERSHVREMADRLGVRFHSETRASGRTDEGSLRQARDGFFDRVMRENGCRGLFLGHNRNDIVESFLIRLGRGVGSGGLAAPRPVSVRGDGFRLRPLLEIEGLRIRETLEDFRIHWMEDATNATDLYLRNRLRHQVVPAWESVERERDLPAAVARSRRLLQEDADALAAWTRRCLETAERGERLEFGMELPNLPRAIRRRVVEAWLAGQGLLEKLSANWIEQVLDGFEEGKAERLSAGSGIWIETDETGLRLSRPVGRDEKWEWQPLTNGIVWCLPDGGVLEVEGPRPITSSDREAIANRSIDPGVNAIIEIPDGTQPGFRNRRSGDRFHPLGGPGTRRLQDCLVDLGIPAYRRSSLPVVCDGETVFWVPGFPPSEACRVVGGTKWVLRLTYKEA